MIKIAASSRYLSSNLPCKLILLYLIVSPFLHTTADAQNFYEEKKADQSRPFYMGSRYGRSGHQTKVQVTPRTDRFFMGSRYGKRASGMELGEIFAPFSASNDLPDGDPQKLLMENVKANPNLLDSTMYSEYLHPHQNRALRCTHLGVSNLYRCYDRDIEQNI